MSRRIFGIDAKDFKKIGFGAEGTIYLSGDNRALKVYVHSGRCISEYKMLTRYSESGYFPKVFECKGHYMLREYVDGTPLLDYLDASGLSDTLAENLIKLSAFFEEQQNIRLDGISRHILILKDESVKVIDPSARKYSLYKRLIEALRKSGHIDTFQRVLNKNRPDLAGRWLMP